MLFKEKGCASCHGGPHFTDMKYHDIGLPYQERDQGLAERTGRTEDRNRFRTPTLRNVWVTGPFMHDGSVSSITEAILAHRKDTAGAVSPRPSEEDAADISIFLETLTDASFIRILDGERVSDRCARP